MKIETGAAPLSWCEALEAEFEALYGAPALGPDAPRDPEERLRAVHARLHQRGPSAVCLSGGGVRSATFALGVLQGLAHTGALKSIDYLSTVSGGGYIGGWLSAWLHRAGPAARGDVMRELDPATAAQTGSLADESPVDRVRRTCRYLAPGGGAVSADMWSLLMTMGRNLLLNWLVLLPLIAAVLLIPRIYYALVFSVEVETPDAVCGWTTLGPSAQTFLAVTAAGFLLPSLYVIWSFAGRGARGTQGKFLSLFLLPMTIAAAAFTLFWSATPCDLRLAPMMFSLALLPAALWLVIGVARRATGTHHNATGTALRVRPGIATVLGSLMAGAVLAAGLYWMAVDAFGFGVGLREFYATFAVPLILLIVILNITVFVGIASHDLDDSSLEWWSRCAGWLAIVAVSWAAAGLLVFFMADLVERGLRAVTTFLEVDHNWSSGLLAIAVPLLSSLAGLAARNAGTDPSKQASPLKATAQALALPLVILALLSSVAWANLRMTEGLEYHWYDAGTPCTPQLSGENQGSDAACHPAGAGMGEVLTLFGVLLPFGLLMSRLVPINRFSLHGMYRERLIRTFLGASRRDRNPNPFTGFDANDDLRMHALADVRPLHVINTTLNALQSTHIGRHESKAQSFTFTPLHVGNRFVGYRPAAEYGSDGNGRSTGLSLGMALAISGAAAASAMGMYSSKARAFLLTLANARLGLWFGNPQSAKTWRRSEPPLGIEPLAREMLGLTTDHNPYVYLSDGGHYENLALWEMVARRCRVIIVSDAGCDPAYAFGDLSNAVRRIRLDLGIPILFEPLPQSREGQGRTNPHGAIATIKYSAVDGAGAPDGVILYLKATLSGDEPVDVRNFATNDPLFPHDSTANQFFDEARFESYRALGYHTVLSVTAGLRDLETPAALCAIAKRTLEPPQAAAGAATV